MTDPIQRWTYDADVGLYCRMEDGNFMLLPHGTEVVLAADAAAHEAAAVADAFTRGREYQQERLTNHDMHSGYACLTNYEQGQRDERNAAHERALADADRHYERGVANERARIRAGVEALAEKVWPVMPKVVLAVIDAAPQDEPDSLCGVPGCTTCGNYSDAAAPQEPTFTVGQRVRCKEKGEEFVITKVDHNAYPTQYRSYDYGWHYYDELELVE
jgi:hypothetical protein